MYRGIEISHPIFGIIFSNLIFPFIMTVLNIMTLLFSHFYNWLRLATSWSLISVLRFLYIKHEVWVHTRWPDVKNLRNIALAAQFGFYVFQLMTFFVTVTIFASPYGWPQKPFLSVVPPHLQVFLAVFGCFFFTLPILISGIFYVKLSRILKRVEPTEKEIVSDGGIYICDQPDTNSPPVKDNSKKIAEKLSNSTQKPNKQQVLSENIEVLNGIGQNRDNKIKIDVVNSPKCLKICTGSQNNLIRKLEEKRDEDERLSAMRSLKTNLILTFLQFFSFMLVLIPSASDRIYIIAFETSVQKGLLPLITTLTNFSTIRLVSLKLWRKFF